MGDKFLCVNYQCVGFGHEAELNWMLNFDIISCFVLNGSLFVFHYVTFTCFGILGCVSAVYHVLQVAAF